MATKQIGDSARNAQDAMVRANEVAAANVNVQASERLEGQGYKAYGGANPNSYLGQFDKYYRHLRGGDASKYAPNTINKRMFNQLMIMDRTTLGQIQPFISGRFIFVVGQMPRMMEILHPDETKFMRTIFQSAVVAVSGFADRNLDTGTIKAMTDQNSYEVITNQTGTTRKLTFTFITMFQGLPLYKYFTTWMQYIYMAGSSAAIYPSLTGLEYHEGNHSMNGVYAVLDPSFQMVQEAALVYSMVPTTNAATNILNQTWGEHSTNQYAVDFKCHTLPGGMPQVQRIAQAALADYVSEVELNDFWVNPADPNDKNMGLGSSLLGPVGEQVRDEHKEVEESK